MKDSKKSHQEDQEKPSQKSGRSRWSDESNVGEAKDDGERESKRWEGCQANPEVMNEPIIKCLCSDSSPSR